MIEDTLNHIHKNFEWLYDNAAVDDKQTFKMICQQKTDGVFQVESDMFKGLVKQIQPKSLEDLAMLVAVGRPGPLSIKANDDLETNRKDPSKRKQYLRNTDDFLDRSSGVILYQEQLMQISVRCFGFNQSQSDSIMRKILGKKKVEQLPMLRRIMIYGMIPGKGPEGWKENEDSPWYDEKWKYGEAIPGGMKFGYTKEEIDKFFNDIQGFASYCFNLGHSLAYQLVA